jgi:hypothetical protein
MAGNNGYTQVHPTNGNKRKPMNHIDTHKSIAMLRRLRARGLKVERSQVPTAWGHRDPSLDEAAQVERKFSK